MPVVGTHLQRSQAASLPIRNSPHRDVLIGDLSNTIYCDEELRLHGGENRLINCLDDQQHNSMPYNPKKITDMVSLVDTLQGLACNTNAAALIRFLLCFEVSLMIYCTYTEAIGASLTHCSESPVALVSYDSEVGNWRSDGCGSIYQLQTVYDSINERPDELEAGSAESGLLLATLRRRFLENTYIGDQHLQYRIVSRQH
ncbi:hypothetical protein RB195_026191 [Necator americanus]|uniref:Uncharacterized protein n=1 Tax=Necator americanus TaxID=51031 RepID=A0ABR1EVT2_NECAM